MRKLYREPKIWIINIKTVSHQGDKGKKMTKYVYRKFGGVCYRLIVKIELISQNGFVLESGDLLYENS